MADNIALKVRTFSPGPLLFAQRSRQAAQRIRKVMRRVANVGRTEARRKIASEFQTRTGFLRRQSRKMQTKVTVQSHLIKSQVTPIPRLMNIFERGATLAHGRGILRPRPVVAPAQQMMADAGYKEISQVLTEAAK